MCCACGGGYTPSGPDDPETPDEPEPHIEIIQVPDFIFTMTENCE